MLCMLFKGLKLVFNLLILVDIVESATVPASSSGAANRIRNSCFAVAHSVSVSTILGKHVLLECTLVCGMP